MDKILERIETLRNDRGWSQYKLSEVSGIAQSTIATWYDGKKNLLPSIASLRKLSLAFNVSLSTLFEDTDLETTGMVEISKDQAALLRKWGRLDAKQQDAIIELLDSIVRI